VIKFFDNCLPDFDEEHLNYLKYKLYLETIAVNYFGLYPVD